MKGVINMNMFEYNKKLSDFLTEYKDIEEFYNECTELDADNFERLVKLSFENDLSFEEIKDLLTLFFKLK